MRTAQARSLPRQGLRTQTRPPVDALRGHTDEVQLDQGGFHCRWYAHHGGEKVGPFNGPAEVTAYMAAHHLPRPDELLAPVEV